MQTKLYLVNNGLKDLCGHFYETAVSIAEAARDAGLKPILAAHVSCPADIVPDWLEFHAHFSVDHWMHHPGADKCQTVHGSNRVRRLVVSAARRALSPAMRRAIRVAWGTLHSAIVNDPLERRLTRVGARPEYEHTRLFQQELECLLADTGCRANDHVFLPTAHGRELIAILNLAATADPRTLPTFHLEYRHALEGTAPWVDPRYRAVHRAFFDHAHTLKPCARLHLYTDTEELTQEYRAFSGLEFGVLPIPFRSNLLGRRKNGNSSLCLGYVGEARTEKGFPYLPDLVEALMAEYVRPGKVRFLIQGTMTLADYDPRSREALRRLQAYPDNQVRLIGVDRPLTPDEYYELLSETDVLLCPYSPAAYRTRSSGILTEGVAAGIPTVVPCDTWLSRNQPAGTGETFSDVPSFVDAVRRVLAEYEAYRAHAVAQKDCWLAIHSPAKLVEALLDNAPVVWRSRARSKRA